MENIFIIEKNTIRNQFFVKLLPLSFHLPAFEVTFIKTSTLTLCRQKEFLYSLKIVHKWRSIIDPFLANHCSAFSYSRSFSCSLSLLTILLDKCQMKSFENINISIKVKLFCVKNVFFWKKLLFERKYVFERKNLKNCFFWCYLKQKIFFQELWIKIFFKNFE